jgi:hydroxymethylbilane synthase
MAERPLRLGTRGSPLALAQANAVAKLLGGAEVVTIKTSEGDPRSGGDKARFVRGIEQALLAGEVDLGVHSAKDLPTELPEGLEIAGVPRRAQLLALRPDLEIVPLRGNVDTRLRRLEEGDFDGLVLAAAGLRRLARAEEAFPIELDELIPAPGQGTIAIESRHADDRATTAAESITDRGTLGTLIAERALVAALDASCNTPLGAIATLEHGGRMRLRAFCGLPDGSEWLRDELEEDASDPDGLGVGLADRMKAAGAQDILGRAEEMAVA